MFASSRIYFLIFCSCAFPSAFIADLANAQVLFTNGGEKANSADRFVVYINRSVNSSTSVQGTELEAKSNASAILLPSTLMHFETTAVSATSAGIHSAIFQFTDLAPSPRGSDAMAILGSTVSLSSTANSSPSTSKPIPKAFDLPADFTPTDPVNAGIVQSSAATNVSAIKQVAGNAAFVDSFVNSLKGQF